MAISNKYVYSGEVWFLIINDLQEISIVKWELPNLEQILSLGVQIQLVIMDKGLPSASCELSLNGLNLEFKFCIILDEVNILKLL